MLAPFLFVMHGYISSDIFYQRPRAQMLYTTSFAACLQTFSKIFLLGQFGPIADERVYYQNQFLKRYLRILMQHFF